MAQLSDAPAGSTDPKRIAPFTEKGHPTSAKARWVAPYLRRYLATIEEALGVRFQRTPSGNLIGALGYGEFGVALATDDGRVVKVTTDDAEPGFGQEIYALQHGSDLALRAAARASVVLIDTIVRLPGSVRHQGCEVPVFAILREDVMPVSDADNVSPSVKAALNAHFDGWAAWFDLSKKSRKTPQMRSNVYMEILDGWEALESEPALEAFTQVQRYLWNLGIPYMDSHRHNFGWRSTPNGPQLVLFDLGGSVALKASDRISPVDGYTFDRYYPWNEALKKVQRV